MFLQDGTVYMNAKSRAFFELKKDSDNKWYLRQKNFKQFKSLSVEASEMEKILEEKWIEVHYEGMKDTIEYFYEGYLGLTITDKALETIVKLLPQFVFVSADCYGWEDNLVRQEVNEVIKNIKILVEEL